MKSATTKKSKLKDVFHKYYEAYTQLFPGLNPEELNFVSSHLAIKEYGKKEFLFKSGEIPKEMGFAPVK